MEKYNGQSGVFKVEEYPNMLAFIGKGNNKQSKIAFGIVNITINGKKEKGLAFIKHNVLFSGIIDINDIKKESNNYEKSFAVVIHDKASIDLLIRDLEYLKDEL